MQLNCWKGHGNSFDAYMLPPETNNVYIIAIAMVLLVFILKAIQGLLGTAPPFVYPLLHFLLPHSSMVLLSGDALARI